MSAPFTGSYTITAGYRYSSGAIHAAHDYAMGVGTPLYAIGDGTVAECNDGVANNTPGYSPGSGSPSNYVLLWTTWKGQPITVFYQHLDAGLKCKVGQKVKAGDLLGYSGNSGNSTGPHLHIATQEGHTYDQYRYQDNDGNNPYLIYPPDQVWETGEWAGETKSEEDDVAAVVILARTSDSPPTTAGNYIKWTEETQDKAKWHSDDAGAVYAKERCVATVGVTGKGSGGVSLGLVKFSTTGEVMGTFADELCSDKMNFNTVVELGKDQGFWIKVLSGEVTSATLRVVAIANPS